MTAGGRQATSSGILQLPQAAGPWQAWSSRHARAIHVSPCTDHTLAYHAF